MGEFLFGSDWERGAGITDPMFQQRLIDAEAQWGPEYVANELGRQELSLFGREGQQGYLDMYAQTAPVMEQMRAETVRAQREADIADVEALGGRATEALRSSDPYLGMLIDQQRGLTDDLYARASGLTPQQSRMAVQAAREGSQARGREMDNLGIFAEALGREEYLRQNRSEAQGAGMNLYNMLRGSSADPFQAILGRPAQALPYGSQAASAAMGIAGQASPAVFDPSAGTNLALQNQANIANYNASVYGADQARSGSILGGLFGGVGNAIGGIWGS